MRKVVHNLGTHVGGQYLTKPSNFCELEKCPLVKHVSGASFDNGGGLSLPPSPGHSKFNGIEVDGISYCWLPNMCFQ